MILGKSAIVIAFVATLISMVYYILAARDERLPARPKQKMHVGVFQTFGRYAYITMTAMVISASVYLFYLFITHQFQVTYVYQYSSRSLPFGLLISSFWAGQQGSFLFWALLTALMGLFLLRKSGNLENLAMVFLNIIQGFFLIILIKASPFEIRAPAPPDGAGLNPLLQNFWMVIHPPILFVGYAAIAFPLVLSFAALIKKEFNSWLRLAFPWTIISSITLGAGIIIGAFWAYETLGWGGYWGWDPVENSSLIPWLTILALLHGLIVQQRNKALAKTNFFFAIISYILVIYATFLTRSGVLSDFSVHSFQDLGINSLLILFIVTVVAMGAIIFIPRFKDFPRQPIDFSAPNRENALVFSIWVFSASAFLIFIGTSSPIISGIFGETSQVDVGFYNKVNLPVAVIMSLLLGITPYLYWVEKDFKEIPKRIILPVILAIVSAAVIMAIGLFETINVVFFFSAAFALWSNLFILIRNARVNWINTAAPLAHFGVAIMFIGIIGSGYFSQSKRVVLTKDQPLAAFEYQVTYMGYSEMPDGKNILNIKVLDGADNYTAKPRLYSTRYNDGVMREPDIKAGFFTDLYISPLELRESHDHQHGPSFSIHKGETKKFAGLTFKFTEFEMANHGNAGEMKVAAVLEVNDNTHKHILKPAMIIGAEGRRTEPAKLGHESENPASIILAGLNADDKRVDLIIEGLGDEAVPTAEQVIIEISKKPFMSILWFGTVLLILGSIIAFKKHIQTE